MAADDPDDYDEYDDESPMRGTLVKILGIVVALGVVVAIGTVLMVRSLGLNQSTSSGPLDSSPSEVAPLPSSALPVPGQSDSGTDLPTPSSATPSGAIQLEASPVIASVMERVSLTGTYANQDNVTLQVQNLENGKWTSFPVTVTVRVGTFQTYIQTGRQGDQQFRVWDPQAHQASNSVKITID